MAQNPAQRMRYARQRSCRPLPFPCLENHHARYSTWSFWQSVSSFICNCGTRPAALTYPKCQPDQLGRTANNSKPNLRFRGERKLKRHGWTRGCTVSPHPSFCNSRVGEVNRVRLDTFLCTPRGNPLGRIRIICNDDNHPGQCNCPMYNAHNNRQLRKTPTVGLQARSSIPYSAY